MPRRFLTATKARAGSLVRVHVQLQHTKADAYAKIAIWSRHLVVEREEDFSPHVDDIAATAIGGQPALHKSPFVRLDTDKPSAVLEVRAHEPMEFAVVQDTDSLNEPSARAWIDNGHAYSKPRWALVRAQWACRDFYVAAKRRLGRWLLGV